MAAARGRGRTLFCHDYGQLVLGPHAQCSMAQRLADGDVVACDSVKALLLPKDTQSKLYVVDAAWVLNDGATLDGANLSTGCAHPK